MSGAVCRGAALADLPDAARLVQRVVRECVGAWFGPEAIAEYCGFAAAEGLASRFLAGHRFWIAIMDGEVKGVLEIKGGAHVLMLFIAPEAQRQGLGRALLGAAFPGFPMGLRQTLTVNAVPQSVAAYVSMGFAPSGPEQNVRGIRFVPMELEGREGA